MTTYRVIKTQPLKKETEMKTIRHITVTPNGIPEDALSILSSEKGIREVYSNSIFGTTQQLLSNAQKLQKFNQHITRLEETGFINKAEAIKESTRFIMTQERALESATRLAILDANATAKGLNIDIELSPTLRKMSPKDKIAEKAKFARMKEEEVEALEQKAHLATYNAQLSAQALAEELFFSAETEEEVIHVVDDAGQTETVIESVPIFFHPESVLKALTKARNWLLTWNEPDYAELGLLSSDMDTVEEALSKFVEMTEHGTESGREFDALIASSDDMTAGTASTT